MFKPVNTNQASSNREEERLKKVRSGKLEVRSEKKMMG